MAGPLDIVLAAHNAFRADIAAIDAAAVVAAEGGPGIDATVERFQYFNTILERHAAGEEAGLFVQLEKVAPDALGPYEIDHRALDLAFEGLTKAITAHDPLGTARATAAFKFHLELHLHKEETHMLPLLEERVTPEDLRTAVGALGSVVPQDEFPAFVRWLFALTDVADRENVLRFWQPLIPPPIYAGIVANVRATIGPVAFAELAARFPDLNTL
jgi:hypothetical protein